MQPCARLNSPQRRTHLGGGGPGDEPLRGGRAEKVRHVQAQEAVLLLAAVALRDLRGVCRRPRLQLGLKGSGARAAGACQVRLRVHALHVATVGPRSARVGLLAGERTPATHHAGVGRRPHKLLLEVGREVPQHPVALRMPCVEETPRRGFQLSISQPPELGLIEESDAQRRGWFPGHVGERARLLNAWASFARRRCRQCMVWRSCWRHDRYAIPGRLEEV
mmetsp:Transcript_80254/g.227224  ORF Transcript_80254/g.227224 Transcript_80254/m.227224 type:complete len:221 (-) Transcript_80254:555-1217(-)